jgi:hypothetical protein
MAEQVWINNIEVLYEPEHLTDFFPVKNQTRAQRLNSLVRLSAYVSLALIMYHSNFKYSLVFVFILFLTWILHNNNPTPPIKTKIQENLEDPKKLDKPSNCTKPTLDNPFMNATMKDYLNVDANGTIIDRPEACDPNDPDIKRDIDSKFNNDLFKDVSDIFGKMNSQRQFYTMPSTQIPNDPNNDFGKWLYNSSQTCKEDQNNCLRTEDVRGKRYIFPDETVNPTNSKRLEGQKIQQTKN